MALLIFFLPLHAIPNGLRSPRIFCLILGRGWLCTLHAS
jgi:hypothetical protein